MKGMRVTNMRREAQQGDVLFIPVEKLPEGCKLKRDGVLALGEATGHAHRLAEATDGLLYEAPDGGLYLVSGPKMSTTVHEEHTPLKRPEGVDLIGRVQEFDHFAEEARQVQD